VGRDTGTGDGTLGLVTGHWDWDGTLGLGRDTGTGTGHWDWDGTLGLGRDTGTGTPGLGCLKRNQCGAPKFVSPRWGSTIRYSSAYKTPTPAIDALEESHSVASRLRRLPEPGQLAGFNSRPGRTRCRDAAPACRCPGRKFWYSSLFRRGVQVVQPRSAPTSRAISLTLGGSAISSVAVGRRTSSTEMDFLRLWSIET
jgi:hypothetical protein